MSEQWVRRLINNATPGCPCGSVAERSKALVLGTSLFGGAGSNPAAARYFMRIPVIYSTANDIDLNLTQGVIGSYREYAIAIESEAGDSLT